MKNPAHHLIAEVPRRQAKVEMTIGIDLGDIWSHYCTLNQDGDVVDRGRFRTTPKAIEKWFTDVPSARVAMEAGTHSIWISEQLQELGHEVIVANVRELRAISHSDRKSDQVDAEKLARYARLDPNILRPISFPLILGTDVSGIVEAVADDVENFSAGDEVYAMVRFPSGLAGNSRAYAEYVSVPASEVALKPVGIDHVHAAGAPMSLLTAWQYLIELGHNEPNPLQAKQHEPVPLQGKNASATVISSR